MKIIIIIIIIIIKIVAIKWIVIMDSD